MGNIILNIPNIEDGELIFNEIETKQILKFFWPDQSASIDNITVTNDVRRLAQTALITAIDGTYAMSFIAGLMDTVANPGHGIQVFARKLAQNFVKKWWKHANPKDLKDAKIYESVRREVSRALKPAISDAIQGADLGSREIMFSYSTLCRSYKA